MGKGNENENADARVRVNRNISWFNGFNGVSGIPMIYGGLIPSEISGGEEGTTLDGGGESVETSEGLVTVRQKQKVRRPTGSKDKNMILDGKEVKTAPKKGLKLGRPKGSKNRKNLFDGKEVQGSISNLGGVNQGINEVDGVGCYGNDGFGEKKRFEKPVGLKNKKKNHDGKEVQGTTTEFTGGGGGDKNDVIGERKKFGRDLKYKNIVWETEENQDIPVVVAGGVASGNSIVKRRMGRPKGSKNKKKILPFEGNQEMPVDFALCNAALDAIVKRGRPKGSKNKKKSLSAEENGGMPSEFGNSKRGRPKGSMNKKLIVAANSGVGCRNDGSDMDRIFNSETSMITYKEGQRCDEGGLENSPHCLTNTESILVVERIGRSGDKDGIVEEAVIGRCKGSKNKKKIQAAEENPAVSIEVSGGSSGGSGGVQRKSGLGRPKGSKNKKITLSSEGNGGMPSEIVIARKGDKSGVRPQGSKKKEKLMLKMGIEERGIDSTDDGGNVGQNSKKETSVVISEEDQIMLGAIVDLSEAGDGDGNIARDIKSKDPNVSVNGGFVQVTKNSCGNDNGDGTVTKKRKRGRPPGSMKKQKLIIAGEVLSSNKEVKDDDGELLTESSNTQKRRRGRPRKNAGEHSKLIHTAEENGFVNSGLSFQRGEERGMIDHHL